MSRTPNSCRNAVSGGALGLSRVALNSRFGIGVFSYFMLAEEVVVTTIPVNRYGLRESLDQASRADIQSGSGLLWITPGKGAPPDGGTRVRLYLALAKDEQPPSLVETLQSLLWVSDYPVRAVEYARDDPRREVRARTWAPGNCQRQRTGTDPRRTRKAPTSGSCRARGKFLLDGVVVKDAPEVYGYIANLRERHRPVPSVDRNELLSHNEELVLEELLTAVPKAAAHWDEVSLRHLWQLTESEAQLTVKLLDTLLPAGVIAVLEPDKDDQLLLRGRLSLTTTGCLPMDTASLPRAYQTMSLGPGRECEDNLFEQWRLSRLRNDHRQDLQFSPHGYPAPIGLDALLFFEAPSQEWGWAPTLKAAAVTNRTLRDAVRALRRYAITGVNVPAVADIRADLAVRFEPSAVDLYSSYRDMMQQQASSSAQHAPLLRVSADHDISLGQAAGLLRELRKLDPELPAVPELDESLTAEIFASEAAGLLATSRSSEWFPLRDWRSGSVSVTDCPASRRTLPRQLLSRRRRPAARCSPSVRSRVLPDSRAGQRAGCPLPSHHRRTDPARDGHPRRRTMAEWANVHEKPTVGCGATRHLAGWGGADRRRVILVDRSARPRRARGGRRVDPTELAHSRDEPLARLTAGVRTMGTARCLRPHAPGLPRCCPGSRTPGRHADARQLRTPRHGPVLGPRRCDPAVRGPGTAPLRIGRAHGPRIRHVRGHPRSRPRSHHHRRRDARGRP